MAYRSPFALAGALVLAFCLVPHLLAQAEPRTGPGIVILRGTLASQGVTDLAFVADRDSLASARLSGVNGAELMAYRGERLLQQAEFYRQAQLAAGRASGQVLPLFVVLDPVGTWAYAYSVARFRFARDGRSQGPFETPVLVLGEGRAYERESQPVTVESAIANRTLLEKLRPWYAQAADASKPPWRVRGTPDVERDVLKRYKLTTGENLSYDLVSAAEILTSTTYLDWVAKAVIEDLTTRGLDGQALWAAFAADAGLAALAEQGRQASLKQRVAETIAHEMGHVIQFAVQGPGGLAPDEHLPHMEGGSHTLDTLSSPGFALTEGWAIANSLVITGTPKPQRPGEANRIDYANTQGVILKKLNTGRARAVAEGLVKAGRMRAEDVFTVPPFNLARAEFDRDLEKAARAKGMTDAEWAGALDQAVKDPELVHLAAVKTYVDALQARKGQKKGRYDFLRSEYAVANTLAKLREGLGPERTGLVLKTMATRKPKTLAGLVEGFVHDQPQLKGDVYRILAEATEGILVTPEQAAFVAEQGAAGKSLEIDLDRDGAVPGLPAGPASPALFPPETSPLPGGADPLRWSGPASRLLPSDLSESAAESSNAEPTILGRTGEVLLGAVTAPGLDLAPGEASAEATPPPAAPGLGGPGLDDLMMR